MRVSHYRARFDDIMLLPKPFLLARWLTSGCATEPRHYTLTLPTFWQTHTYCLSSGRFFFCCPPFFFKKKEKCFGLWSFLLSQHTRTFLSPPRFFPPSRQAALTFWTASREWRGGGGTTVGPPVIVSHETPTQTPPPLPYFPSLSPVSKS